MILVQLPLLGQRDSADNVEVPAKSTRVRCIRCTGTTGTPEPGQQSHVAFTNDAEERFHNGIQPREIGAYA